MDTLLPSRLPKPSLVGATGFLSIVCLVAIIAISITVTERLYEESVVTTARFALRSATINLGSELNSYLKVMFGAATDVLDRAYIRDQPLPTLEEEEYAQLNGLMASNMSRNWRQTFTDPIVLMMARDAAILSSRIVFSDGAMIEANRSEAALLSVKDVIPFFNTTDNTTTTYAERRSTFTWFMAQESSFSTFQLASLQNNNVEPIYTTVDGRNASWFSYTEQQLTISPFVPSISSKTQRPMLSTIVPVWSKSRMIGKVMIDYDFSSFVHLLLMSRFTGLRDQIEKGFAFGVDIDEQLNNQYQAFALVDGFVMASSDMKVGDYQRGFHATSVPANYEMILSDYLGRCTVINATKYCPHSVGTYHSPILRRAIEVIDPSHALGGEGFGFQTTDMEFEGRKYMIGASTTSHLQVIYLLPIDALSVIYKSVRNTIVIIAVISTVVAAVVLAVLTRVVLAPIGDIARKMDAAAYLQDESPSIPPDGPDRELYESNLKLKNELLVRKLSIWSEVRAIQKAYWKVHDQVQKLKAYLPEHIVAEAQFQADLRRSQKEKPSSREHREMEDISKFPVSLDTFDQTENENCNKNKSPSPPSGSPTKNPMARPSEAGDDDSKSINSMTSANEFSLKRIPAPTKPAVIPFTSDPQVEGDDRKVYFYDSALIDREITIVHININRFHEYVVWRRHPMGVSADYAQFITYLQGEVKRFGGVLESFSGDKIFVSFNATCKCDDHPIVAAYFAYSVATTINTTVKNYMAASKDQTQHLRDPRFRVCMHGISCGAATGSAYVGPLGNAVMKRHTIISNAMTESQALERLCQRYGGSCVMVSHSFLSHINGYFQYMIIDVTALPGTKGNRVCVASLRGPMCDPEVQLSNVLRRILVLRDDPQNPELHRTSPYEFWIENPYFNTTPNMGPHSLLCVSLPTINRYDTANWAMTEYFRGRYDEAERHLYKLFKEAEMEAPDKSTNELVEEFVQRRYLFAIVGGLLRSLMDNNVDGKMYRAALGQAYESPLPVV